MKKYAITFCLLLTAFTVQARGIRDEANLAEEKARTSYAMGMTVGGDLQNTGIEIDYAAFAEGLKDAMEEGYTRLDRGDALEIVQNAFENAMLRQSSELREKEIAFLEENAAREDVYVTQSGLQYQVLVEGSGPKPLESDTVRVHYEGSLIDGNIFDSSYPQAQPEEIPLEMVIPGWAEGMQLMNVGSKYVIYIPSSLAFGERGAGQIIPPYSTLIFTIELIDIVREPEGEE